MIESIGKVKKCLFE